MKTKELTVLSGTVIVVDEEGTQTESSAQSVAHGHNEIKSDFLKWIDKVGGASRVARVLGVDRKTVWRYCAAESERQIPKLWLKFKEMSEDLEVKNQRLAKYERRFGKL